MSRRSPMAAVSTLLLVGALLTACGDGGGDTGSPTAPSEDEPTTTQAALPQASITARDFAFDVPSPMPGGVVSLSYTNAGKEPHFVAFAKIAPGKTIDDVKAALLQPPPTSPPPGPPPFEDVAGFPTTEPGAKGQMTVNVPAGSYAFYCQIPSPDGTSHAAKGMVTPVTVSDGTDAPLPAAAGTIKAVDFSLNPLPDLEPGSNVVRISNQGKQLHEIGLAELSPGRTVENAAAWFRQESGPPPFRFLAGAAVRPGSDATTEVNLEPGKTYAFICAIPDFLADFAPHITKGMYTSAFTVS